MPSQLPRYETYSTTPALFHEGPLAATLADMRAEVIALERAIHAGQDTTAIWNRLARCKSLLEHAK